MSLFTPTNSKGFSSSGSTKPILGKKIVALVEVFIIAPFEFFLVFSECFNPEPSSSCSIFSKSNISEIVETKWGKPVVICNFDLFSFILVLNFFISTFILLISPFKEEVWASKALTFCFI